MGEALTRLSILFSGAWKQNRCGLRQLKVAGLVLAGKEQTCSQFFIRQDLHRRRSLHRRYDGQSQDFHTHGNPTVFRPRLRINISL